MKSYAQFCSIARALDLVGDRWTLLIVRELLTFGPSRYSDLKRGLPGIASNLLAERLRIMESDGLVERHDAPAPVAANLYELTPRGQALHEVMQALSRWGLELMPEGAGDDARQPQWTALFAGLELAPHVEAGAEVVLGIEADGEAVRAVLRRDSFEIRRGPAPDADVTVSGPAAAVAGVVTGLLTPQRATKLGAKVTGTPVALTDLIARAARSSDEAGEPA